MYTFTQSAFIIQTYAQARLNKEPLFIIYENIFCVSLFAREGFLVPAKRPIHVHIRRISLRPMHTHVTKKSRFT